MIKPEFLGKDEPAIKSISFIDALQSNDLVLF